MSADTPVAAGVLTDPFAASHDIFEALIGWLGLAEAAALSAAELEERLQEQSREVFRQLFADYLELRARDELRLSPIVDAQGATHGTVEGGHSRPLTTVFGEVQVRRIAYRKRGCPNLYPADAGLNLPTEKQSHGLRKLAAVESSRGSFDEAVQAIERATGQKVGKRQVEDLAALAAVDFESFYATRLPPPGTGARPAGVAGRRQRHRDAPRRAAPRDHESSGQGPPQAEFPTEQGREAQP